MRLRVWVFAAVIAADAVAAKLEPCGRSVPVTRMACRDGAPCDLDATRDGACFVRICAHSGQPGFHLCPRRSPERSAMNLLSLRSGSAYGECERGSGYVVRCRPSRRPVSPSASCTATVGAPYPGTYGCHAHVYAAQDGTPVLYLRLDTPAGVAQGHAIVPGPDRQWDARLEVPNAEGSLIGSFANFYYPETALTIEITSTLPPPTRVRPVHGTMQGTFRTNYTGLLVPVHISF